MGGGGPAWLIHARSFWNWCFDIIFRVIDCINLIVNGLNRLPILRVGSRYVEGIPRYCFSKMYHNVSRSQRFGLLIFKDVLRFQKNDLPKCSEIPGSIQTYSKSVQDLSKICQIYQDLLRSQDYPKCFRISKILARFHHVGFLCFKRWLKPIVFDPPTFNFQCW